MCVCVCIYGVTVQKEGPGLEKQEDNYIKDNIQGAIMIVRIILITMMHQKLSDHTNCKDYWQNFLLTVTI